MNDYFVPVLPSSNIEKDVQFYVDGLGFEQAFADDRYALLRRHGLELHLQWHADTSDDPLLGGSVVRIITDDVDGWYATAVERKVISPNHAPKQTAWGTYEFGFFVQHEGGT